MTKIEIEEGDLKELLEVLRLYNQEDETAIYSDHVKLERNHYWIDIGMRGAIMLKKFGIKPAKDFII